MKSERRHSERRKLPAFAKELISMANDVIAHADLTLEEKETLRQWRDQLRDAVDALMNIFAAHDALQMAAVDWNEPFDPHATMWLNVALSAAFMISSRAGENPISARLDRVQIPALHITGWFDTYIEGSINGYLALRNHAGTEFERQNQYLIAGPWIHIPWGDRVGDVNLGEAANLDTDEILLRWFDRWLKDSESFSNEPSIRYFALGPNEWRAAAEWPSAAACPLFLHSQGKANSRKGDGTLAVIPPGGEEPRDVFVYDPEVPVVAPGGLQALSGPLDQAVLEMGNNLLVYTSEPVLRETEIFGHPRMKLYAATSAGHADFTAKIVRVTTAGRAEFLSIGIARSTLLFKDEPYEAGRIHSWEFTLEPVSFVLAPGERLRMEIASSAFPLYDRNPFTAIPPQDADNWSWARSTQQVLHSAEFPSAIYLPVKGGAGW